MEQANQTSVQHMGPVIDICTFFSYLFRCASTFATPTLLSFLSSSYNQVTHGSSNIFNLVQRIWNFSNKRVEEIRVAYFECGATEWLFCTARLRFDCDVRG